MSGRRGRILKENITAYLMILPAVGLIFTFGLFPVAFAVYVSMHRWRIKMGKFLGLQHYVKGIDTLAYVAFFGLALGALVLAVIYSRRVVRTARENNDQPWLLLLPSVLLAAGGIQMAKSAVLLLPEILGIADKIVGQEKSRELFMRLLGEAFRAETVWPEMVWVGWLLAVGVLLAAALLRLSRSPDRAGVYLLWMFLAGLSGTIAVIAGRFTYTQVQEALAAALEEGQDPGLWPQIAIISAGLILLGLAWVLWQSAERQISSARMVLRLLGALVLIVAGWVLVGELAPVIAAGDKDVWDGLKVTAMFSLGTVPVQLTIALFLAYLLFQNLRGKDFFRVVFFLPYVTPTVASAAIFRVMFSNRPAAAINQILGKIGIEAQNWLLEPTGVFQLIADNFGVTLPGWAAGPSQALVVIITFGVWTFVGYNTVIYLAGLGNIPEELHEAAAIDGASRWAIFRHVTFPLLSPTTYFLSLLAVIGTFKAFNHVWILRRAAALGTTDTFSIVIFTEFFQKSRFGYASALAFVLFGVILTLTLVNNRMQGSRVFYG